MSDFALFARSAANVTKTEFEAMSASGPIRASSPAYKVANLVFGGLAATVVSGQYTTVARMGAYLLRGGHEWMNALQAGLHGAISASLGTTAASGGTLALILAAGAYRTGKVVLVAGQTKMLDTLNSVARWTAFGSTAAMTFNVPFQAALYSGASPSLFAAGMGLALGKSAILAPTSYALWTSARAASTMGMGAAGARMSIPLTGLTIPAGRAGAIGFLSYLAVDQADQKYFHWSDAELQRRNAEWNSPTTWQSRPPKFRYGLPLR